MKMSSISPVISDQFQRTLAMFREVVAIFPQDEWRRGDLDYLRPAGVAYHIIETIDFYISDEPVERFSWGGRFGVGWEDNRSESLPSKDQILGYLDEAEAKLAAWFEKTDLLAPESVYPWTGENLLARAIYVLRNTQHHVAEMSLELTRRGFSGPEWK